MAMTHTHLQKDIMIMRSVGLDQRLWGAHSRP